MRAPGHRPAGARPGQYAPAPSHDDSCRDKPGRHQWPHASRNRRFPCANRRNHRPSRLASAAPGRPRKHRGDRSDRPRNHPIQSRRQAGCAGCRQPPPARCARYPHPPCAAARHPHSPGHPGNCRGRRPGSRNAAGQWERARNVRDRARAWTTGKREGVAILRPSTRRSSVQPKNCISTQRRKGKARGPQRKGKTRHKLSFSARSSAPSAPVR